MENRIADKFLDGFNEEELEILCKNSNYETLKLYKYIQEKNKFINGLFYEIEQVHGNWTRKDRILPGIFQEIFELLSSYTKELKEYFDKNEKYCFSRSEFEREDKIKNCYNLFNYLIDKFEQLFLRYEKKYLSEKYTHNLLRKEIRKIKIRISNILEDSLKYFENESYFQAKEGLNNIIIDQLKREDFPIIENPNNLVAKFNYVIEDNSELMKKFIEAFKPSYGNNEYKLGLKTIWEDLPGTGIGAYYFNHIENDIVLIVERPKPSLKTDDGISYCQTGPSIYEFFNIKESEQIFLDWLSHEKVKEEIAWILFSPLMYRYRENYENISEDKLKQSTEFAKNKLELIEKYYGVSFSFKEFTDIAKEIEIKLIEDFNVDDEIKERQIEIINKLFPMEELKEND